MYGVYIVDDEILVIKNIIRTVSWKENGFNVIGYNTDPELAIKDIQKIKPDLIFCDLKMPIMNGLEFIKKCRENNITCEFIMLSAFGDFDTSRSFFLLDGFDYMLKPIDDEQAESVLLRLSQKLSKKNFASYTIPAYISTGTNAFNQLVKYISENFQKKYTLSSLSKQFNISETYICNLFAKHYHSTLTMYLTKLRMNEAARLITNTDKALKEIAILCGYSDYFYFCRTFKNFFGESPTEYRNKNS